MFYFAEHRPLESSAKMHLAVARVFGTRESAAHAWTAHNGVAPEIAQALASLTGEASSSRDCRTINNTMPTAITTAASNNAPL